MQAPERKIFLCTSEDLAAVHPYDREAAKVINPYGRICQGDDSEKELFKRVCFRAGELKIKKIALKAIPDEGLFFGDPVHILARGGKNTTRSGRIADIFLHEKKQSLYYTVHTGQRLLSKRYFFQDLQIADPERQNLEDALLRNRENLDLWSVYADCLLSRNDPRGELCALDVELERKPMEKRLKFQRKRLGEPFAEDLKSAFGEIAGTKYHRAELELKYGLIFSLHLQFIGKYEKNTMKSFAALIKATLNHESTLLLEELSLAPPPTRSRGFLLGLTETFANLSRSPAVKKLTLTHAEALDNSGILNFFPELEHLVLTNHGPGTVALHHPNLKSLELDCQGLPDKVILRWLQKLIQNPLPNLESFTLLRTFDYNAPRKLLQFRKPVEEVLPLLCNASFFSRLREFRLPVPLTPEAASFIRKNASIFKKLETFEFNRHYLTRRQLQKLDDALR